MTGQPYAEEDVELVVSALFRDMYHHEPNGPVADFPEDSPFLSQARAVLAAQAAAGRLIPPDRPARSCGCPLKYVAGVDVRHQDGCEVIEKRRREDAELRAWEKATGHTEDW